MKEPLAIRSQDTGDQWTEVIRPHGPLFDLKFKELWAYRDLIALFVRRDFVALYKQTILGPAWHFVQPLFTTVVFTIVFGRLAKISTDGAPPFLFYMAGTVIWSYFAATLNGTANIFVRNFHILGKVYFPRLVLPLSVTLSCLISLGIQFSFFLLILAWYLTTTPGLHPNVWILATPVLVLMMASLALGLGIIVSAMTTRYRDLGILVGFGVQLLMFASPVIYPLSFISEPYRSWAALNPIAPILEAFRYAFLGTGAVNVSQLAASSLVTMLVLGLGVVLFNRVERTFMDTV